MTDPPGAPPASTKNDELAALRAAAERGDAEAQFKLALAYEAGQLVAADSEQAWLWMLKAAEQGHGDATVRVGCGYLCGNAEVEKDYEQCLAWFRKGAELGHAPAQDLLARCYTGSYGHGSDEEQAFSWFKKASEQGYENAQTDLARCYLDGTGTEKDVAQAVRWFEEAAERGHMHAPLELADIYKRGLVTERDDATMARWLARGDELGDLWATEELARCYQLGIGVEKDAARAAELHEKSAFILYFRSRPRFATWAERWDLPGQDGAWSLASCRNSARRGHPEGQHLFGCCHASSLDIPLSYTKARSWFLAAAEQDNLDAMYALGVLHEKGRGAPGDLGEALAWYRKAAEQGNEPAIDALERLGHARRGVEPTRLFAIARKGKVAASQPTDTLPSLLQLYPTPDDASADLVGGDGYDASADLAGGGELVEVMVYPYEQARENVVEALPVPPGARLQKEAVGWAIVRAKQLVARPRPGRRTAFYVCTGDPFTAHSAAQALAESAFAGDTSVSLVKVTAVAREVAPVAPGSERDLILSGRAPAGFAPRDHLDLSGFTEKFSLPRGLLIKGDLDLSGCTGLSELPDDLRVSWALRLRGATSLTHVPPIRVGGLLDLSGCTALESLASGLVVVGDLDLRGCKRLRSLPRDLVVGGNIHRDGYTRRGRHGKRCRVNPG